MGGRGQDRQPARFVGGLCKSVAHFAEPSNYPLAADLQSVEQILLARFRSPVGSALIPASG